LRGEAPLDPALSGPDAPVWTRAVSQGDPDAAACAPALAALDALGMRRLVVAHTVHREGITPACGGRVWRVDVGLARHYGGPLEVLELRGDVVTVLGR
jgi:hypothetical protein